MSVSMLILLKIDVGIMLKIKRQDKWNTMSNMFYHVCEALFFEDRGPHKTLNVNSKKSNFSTPLEKLIKVQVSTPIVSEPRKFPYFYGILF